MEAVTRPRTLLALRPTTAMLLWGLAVGLLGALALLATIPHYWAMETTRAQGLRAALAELERGGPLLVGRNASTGKLYVVGSGDDHGMYVYLPLLCRLFGVTNWVPMLHYFYVTLTGLVAVVYPLIFYKLTRSLLAGIAAPLILLVCVRSLEYVDFLWVPALGVLALFPVIYLLARNWPRFGLLVLMALALIASWLSSIRADSGLPIIIAAAMVLLLQRWRWWRALPALGLLALLYISINTFVIAPLETHADHVVGITTKNGDVATTHPFWHMIYIGYGYLPNRYGLHYDDAVARDRVQREAPGTPFLSARYESVIRNAYLRLWLDHPGEAVKQYAAKMLVITADTTPYLLFVLLTMPAMLLLGPGRRIRRRWVLLTLPALFIMSLPSLFVVPARGFEEGLYGVLGVLGILGICWMIARIEVLIRERGGVRPALAALRGKWSASRIQHGPLWQSARISCIGVVVLVALCIGAHFVSRSAEHWGHFESEALIDDVHSDLADA
jgi:hypothetical protein